MKAETKESAESMISYLPGKTKHMRATCNPRLLKDREANWTLVIVFYCLGQYSLETDLCFRAQLDLRRVGFVHFVYSAEMLEVVRRDQARMKRELPHSGEHAENIGLNLDKKSEPGFRV